MKGYVWVWRKIQNKGWYKNSKYVHLWVHLLVKANHKQSEFMWNNKIIVVRAGQVLVGRKELAKETGISESSVERILNLFENEHQIEQQKTTKFRIITILNWVDYQNADITLDNRRTTDGQQTDTNNNDNNDNNIASNSIELPRTPLSELTYEPLKGMKTSKAFADRARAKLGKPPLLKKDPATWGIIELYIKQYRYITGKTPKVSDSDYFHVLKMTKRLSPKEMEELVIWYVKMDNRKFKDHPNLRSIFTEENINKFNLDK